MPSARRANFSGVNHSLNVQSLHEAWGCRLSVGYPAGMALKRDPDVGQAHKSQRRPRPNRRDPSLVVELNERVWAKWVSGKNARVIAIEEDLTSRQVESILSKMKKVVEESMPTVDEFRTMIVEGTRQVLTRMTEVMEAPPAPAYSNGRPIIDERTGETALDYSARLNAADRVLRAHERLAKIVGVEAPTEANITVIAQAESLASVAAREALARLQQAANPLPITSSRDVEPVHITVEPQYVHDGD